MLVTESEKAPRADRSRVRKLLLGDHLLRHLQMQQCIQSELAPQLVSHAGKQDSAGNSSMYKGHKRVPVVLTEAGKAR